MNYLRVRNWKKFQHFKERTPPWIKLYSDLLDDYVYNNLPTESQAIAPLIWLMASQQKELGMIEGDINLISYRLRREKEFMIKAIKPLVDAGYFEISDDFYNILNNNNKTDIDINVISPRYQVVIPETYSKEGYKKEEYSKETELLFEKNFSQFWDWFPEVNRKKGSMKKAKESFKAALKKDDFNQIMQGVDMYAKHIRCVGQSNADAFRWLTDERWKDNWTLTMQQREPTNPKREYEEAAVRGMLRAANPDF